MRFLLKIYSAARPEMRMQNTGRRRHKSCAEHAEKKNVFFASFAQLLRPLRPVFGFS
jgi:hypothetical protein